MLSDVATPAGRLIRQNALVATAGDADFRRLVRDEVGPALAGGGFARHARKLMWSRQRVEVQHGIALLRRRGSVDIQWAVIVPEATPFIWGVPHPPDDIGYHVLTGSPGDIRHPAAAGSFATSELESEARYAAIAEGVREDIRLMDEFMARFDTRREVRELLLEAARSGIHHFSRSMKGLLVMNAAVLAILDRDPSRYELVEHAVEGLQRFAGPVAAGRIARLRAAVE